MKIPSKDVIQADTPDRVALTIEAVGHGARTDQRIANAIGGLDPRQGRYYRLAAEILGFTTRRKGNDSVLTVLGQKYIRSSAEERRVIFLSAFLSNPLVTRLIPFLEAHPQGANREDLEVFLGSVAALGTRSTIHRRVSSYIGWLQHFDLAEVQGGTLKLKHLPSTVPLIAITSDEEPVFPNRYELREYEEQARRVRKSGEEITYLVNQASRERALASHSSLIEMMAEKLRRSGAFPKANRYIDLSARFLGRDFIFEMKSTTSINIHEQIRRGLSQLYEYRYIQNVQEARLVLVIESPLPRHSQWIVDYLLEDRDILLVWDGSGGFFCPERIASELPFLS